MVQFASYFSSYKWPYCFLILGDEFLFLNHFFIFRFFLLFYVILLLLIFTKTMLLLSFYLIIVIFFHENYFYFFMFRDVPGCSGMFHVPDFIDAPGRVPERRFGAGGLKRP